MVFFSYLVSFLYKFFIAFIDKVCGQFEWPVIFNKFLINSQCSSKFCSLYIAIKIGIIKRVNMYQELYFFKKEILYMYNTEFEAKIFYRK